MNNLSAAMTHHYVRLPSTPRPPLLTDDPEPPTHTFKAEMNDPTSSNGGFQVPTFAEMLQQPHNTPKMPHRGISEVSPYGLSVLDEEKVQGIGRFSLVTKNCA